MERLVYFGYFTTDGVKRFERCRRSRYRVVHKYRVSRIKDTWDVVIERLRAEGAAGILKGSEQAWRCLKRDVIIMKRDIIGDSGRREASASFVD